MTKGQRIRKKREEINMSQVELAKAINVSKQTLYKYENDIVTNIPSDKILQIANVCGCTPDYIMGWEDGLMELAEKTVQQRTIDSYMSDHKIRELVLFAGGIEPGVERDKFIDAFITTYRTLRGGA